MIPTLCLNIKGISCPGIEQIFTGRLRGMAYYAKIQVILQFVVVLLIYRKQQFVIFSPIQSGNTRIQIKGQSRI
jgi:hypothetical protein